MQPEIDVLGIPVKTFGLAFALGFLVAALIMDRRLKEIGKPADWAYEIMAAALVGGLVGARLYWLVQHPSAFSDDPLGSVFGGTGLVWYGGLLGGALGVCLWARWRGWLTLAMADLVCVPLALGYAIGRIGCQLSGDGDYGKASDLPWAMAYPHGTVPTTQRVQPTPIYETLAMGLVAWALWRMRDRVAPGRLFAWYLVGAGVERFVVELWRRNNDALAGLTGPQLESVVVALVGAAWLVVGARRAGGAGRRPA